MADDFIGMNSKGKTYNKLTLIQQSLESANLYTAEAYNIKIEFYGTTAIAQGGETWTKLSDSTKTNSVWTDTWIYRNNKWEIIAAADLKLNQKTNQVCYAANMGLLPWPDWAIGHRTEQSVGIMEERKELNDNDQFKLDRLKKIKELTDDICYKT